MTQPPAPESPPPSPPHQPQRTPEQHAAVRRRSQPVAIVANVLGVVALAMLGSRTVDVHMPPDLFAANISFCAILMGVGILFYAGGTPGLRVARVLCLTAILLGLAGPALFARQSLQWRVIMESTEKQRAVDIAQAAAKYAGEHGGAYPPDLATLLEGKYVTPETLLSPWGGQGTEYHRDMQQKGQSTIKMATPADYTYVGGDLHVPLPPAAASAIIVVYETEPVLRDHFAVAFADGTSRILTLDEALKVLQACNKARATLKLPPLKKPESMERAAAAQTQP